MHSRLPKGCGKFDLAWKFYQDLMNFRVDWLYELFEGIFLFGGGAGLVLEF